MKKIILLIFALLYIFTASASLFPLYLQQIVGNKDDIVPFSIFIDSSKKIKALQCDLVLPSKTTIYKTDDAYDIALYDTSTDHTLSCRYNNRREAFSIVILSATGQSLDIQNGQLIQGNLSINENTGHYEAFLTNIRVIYEGETEEVLWNQNKAAIIVGQSPMSSASIVLNYIDANILLENYVHLFATVEPENTTDPINWISDNPEVATVDTDGYVYAHKEGNCTISAICGDNKANCNVTVYPDTYTGLLLNSHYLSLGYGESKTLHATFPPGNYNIEWASENEEIATVTSDGVVTGRSSGITKITASSERGSDECTVAINEIKCTNIIVENNISAEIGDRFSISVYIVPENTFNKSLTWSSSNPNVATVDEYGNVEIISEGEAIISVTCGDVTAQIVITASKLTQNITWENETNVNVNDVIILNAKASSYLPLSYEIVNGEDICELKDNTLIILDEGEIEIKVSQKGNEIYKAASMTKIFQSSHIIPISITLSPSETLVIGEELILVPIFTPETTTDRKLEWASSNPEIAKVDMESGKVTAISEGQATITAIASKYDITCTCEITVTGAPIPVSSINMEEEMNLYLGVSQVLEVEILPENATNKTLTWSSSDETVATVDENGCILGVAIGEAIITATSINGVSAKCKVTVITPPLVGIFLESDQLTIPIGGETTITAQILPEDAEDKTIIWSSSDTNIVTIDQEGHILGIAQGTAYIQAVWGDFTAECLVNVTTVMCESITLNETNLSMRIDDIVTLIATLTPDYISNPDIEWSSSKESVAVVDEEGNVKALSTGTATIKAKCNDKTAKCTITVNKKLQTIVWEQDFSNLIVGDAITLVANATSELDVAFEVTKGSKICTLDNDVLTITGIGIIKITATQSGNEKYRKADPVVKEIVISETSRIGDVNRDGIINIVDFVIIMDSILGKESANFDVEAADLNADGSIDSDDAELLHELILQQ